MKRVIDISDEQYMKLMTLSNCDLSRDDLLDMVTASVPLDECDDCISRKAVLDEQDRCEVTLQGMTKRFIRELPPCFPKERASRHNDKPIEVLVSIYDDYTHLKDAVDKNSRLNAEQLVSLERALKNGLRLPEKYGNLIDGSRLIYGLQKRVKDLNSHKEIADLNTVHTAITDFAPTVIKANADAYELACYWNAIEGDEKDGSN